MSVSRQDAWTQDEDLILAELVLRHIREGSTQLNAFEEVGKRLSRTSAACGFRWNSYVRKQYNSGIELAKKQRKENKKFRLNEKEDVFENETVDHEMSESVAILSLEDVIAFLISLQRNSTSKGIEEEKLKHEIDFLCQENEELKKEVRDLEDRLHIVEDDYRALIEIMDKARKMVVSEDGRKNQKVKFQMDKNGNLERVKK
ncbi:RsfA family transcriptional regulator [Bacillus massiliigorillae]|uniref:RsfA family transcriptional regulator n=1 Tax=Bacillus massiliigorillae TaxID=1243664 RepID=UPI0003A57CD4|nr:RsfA family transcriptional regulator [Bacillus massiliigorillae]